MTAKMNTDRVSATELREMLVDLREILLANVVMASEIPAPTGSEEDVVRFLFDRFNEAGLNHVCSDEVGNTAAILPGTTAKRNILVGAHVDKIWSSKEDHTISVTKNFLSGKGVADNSLGVAVLATLPIILERLGIQFESNLILLGNVGSFGRGDLKGMRFFLDNLDSTVDSALCLEGIQLGRLSFSSVGMVRGEISVTALEESDWQNQDRTGAIAALNKIIDSILAIERPERPKTSILLGSMEAGSGYNVPPTTGVLRFEIRSESADIVEKIRFQIEEIVEECRALEECEATLEIVAHRSPGDIGFDHPFVRAARGILSELNIKTRIAPSVSEVSALLDKGIPALTLGLTYGENRHEENESIQIDPIFDGIAQLIAMLQFMDKSGESCGEA